MIDNEVGEIISEQYSRALEILMENKEVHKNGARLLLEKEKIEGEELKALMDKVSKRISDKDQ